MVLCKTLPDRSTAGRTCCRSGYCIKGTVVTEDLTYMLECMGYSTGIDLRRLLRCGSILSRAFADMALDGYVARSGLPDSFQPATNGSAF